MTFHTRVVMAIVLVCAGKRFCPERGEDDHFDELFNM